MELLEDLESLKFIAEEGIHKWLYLKNRSRGLMIKGCAHAIFFCKLIENVRKLLKERQPSRRIWMSRKDNPEDELKVGIIGGGHLGKQLIRALLKLVPVSPDNLRVSSRRPETLEEFRNLGVQCFYRNSSLVQWANVVFLCCLPAQLPHICMEIQTNLRPECIVYSFVTAIPIARLKILLNHSSILRPQYQCTRLLANVWGTNKDVVTALRDPEIIRATCPYSPSGGITLNSKWLEGVLYAVLNLCRTKRMPNLHALVFLNKVFLSSHFEDCDKASCPRLQAVDFVSKAFAKTLTHRKPFPWFDLTAVQLKANPLMQNLTSNAAFQDHLTWRYCDLFGISLAKEQIPARSTDSQSQ